MSYTTFDKNSLHTISYANIYSFFTNNITDTLLSNKAIEKEKSFEEYLLRHINNLKTLFYIEGKEDIIKIYFDGDVNKYYENSNFKDPIYRVSRYIVIEVLNLENKKSLDSSLITVFEAYYDSITMYFTDIFNELIKD